MLWQRDTEAALDAVAADGVEILRPDKTAFEDRVRNMLADYESSELGPLIRRIREL